MRSQHSHCSVGALNVHQCVSEAPFPLTPYRYSLLQNHHDYHISYPTRQEQTAAKVSGIHHGYRHRNNGGTPGKSNDPNGFFYCPSTDCGVIHDPLVLSQPAGRSHYCGLGQTLLSCVPTLDSPFRNCNNFNNKNHGSTRGFLTYLALAPTQSLGREKPPETPIGHARFLFHRKRISQALVRH